MRILDVSLNEPEHAARVHKALASEERLRIISLLTSQSYCISDLAQILGIPMSTAAFHVRVLEDANLVLTEKQAGEHGTQKVCNILYNCVETFLEAAPIEERAVVDYVTYPIPIGSYCDCSTHDYSGILDKNGYVGQANQPASFYLPERLRAQMIWFHYGYLEYRIPMAIPKKRRITSLRITFEACSETAFYDNNWPSDIFVSINGIELGVWTSPGDFGGRHGLLTPEWWGNSSTQFGKLKSWEVNTVETLLDDRRLSGVTIADLDLRRAEYFTLRIGVHKDAVNLGGMNLFGERFGDHPQAILIQIGSEGHG